MQTYLKLTGVVDGVAGVKFEAQYWI